MGFVLSETLNSATSADILDLYPSSAEINATGAGWAGVVVNLAPETFVSVKPVKMCMHCWNPGHNVVSRNLGIIIGDDGNIAGQYVTDGDVLARSRLDSSSKGSWSHDGRQLSSCGISVRH